MSENPNGIAGRRGMNTPVQGSPTQGQCRNTGRTIVRVLQGAASKLRRAARLAMDNPTRRSLLKMLVTHDNGVTYQQLFEALPVSERWVREIVADLRREGIVETPGNPALIQFTTHDMMVAVKEVLTFLASDWVETITGEKDVHTAISSSSNSAPALDTEKYLKTLAGILRGTGG